MAYDNSSLTGDEICDYYYDIENNFMNPPSPTGFFMYKVIGGAFDRIAELVNQFRNDYSILDCNVGNVEIVKSFPEEPDTTHTYYVAQYATAEERVFTKYYYVDEWVTETVTGDVLNSLDTFWGRSYNLLRPLLYEGVYREYLFVDEGTTSNHNDNWKINNNMTVTRSTTETTLTQTTSGSSGGFYETQYNGFNLPSNCVIEFDCNINTGRTDNGGWISLRDNTTVRQWIKLERFDLSYGEWYHYKLEIDGTSLIINIDDNTYSATLTSAVNNLVFNTRDDVTSSGNKVEIKYKNFKVYHGEGMERYLTDDEYRIYLYLKNHQLLTMKDLLVAFTNAFGSAEISTTILNSIHTVDHKTYDNPQFSNDSLRAYDDEDMDITTDKLVDKDGVNLINNRLAQGTTSILIPDDGWDEEFLSLLESFISIKGNILISQGG